MGIIRESPPVEAGNGWKLLYALFADNTWIHKQRKIIGKYIPATDTDNVVVYEWREMAQYENGFELSTITALRDIFFEKINNRNIESALCLCSDGRMQVCFVIDNFDKLLQLKLLSRAIYFCWVHYPYGVERYVLRRLLTSYGYDDAKPATNNIPTDDDIITVYRGVCEDEYGVFNDEYINGFSWTLEPRVAKYFAQNFGSNGKIFSGKIRRKDIVFYTNEREEMEVVTLPEQVFDVELWQET